MSPCSRLSLSRRAPLGQPHVLLLPHSLCGPRGWRSYLDHPVRDGGGSEGSELPVPGSLNGRRRQPYKTLNVCIIKMRSSVCCYTSSPGHGPGFHAGPTCFGLGPKLHTQSMRDRLGCVSQKRTRVQTSATALRSTDYGYNKLVDSDLTALYYN